MDLIQSKLHHLHRPTHHVNLHFQETLVAHPRRSTDESFRVDPQTIPLPTVPRDRLILSMGKPYICDR